MLYMLLEMFGTNITLHVTLEDRQTCNECEQARQNIQMSLAEME